MVEQLNQVMEISEGTFRTYRAGTYVEVIQESFWFADISDYTNK
jgi:hypothetical protein